MRGLKKKIGLAVMSSGALASLMALPSTAFALGWDPDDMMDKAGTGTGVGLSSGTINQQTLADWVMGLTTFLLGIAIVLFVLKVVLTAVDRMIFKNDINGGGGGGGGGMPGRGGGGGGGGSNGFSLANIPIVGAYPQDVEWKTIFIHFGKNVAIVAGAWVLVQIVVSVILFVFGTLTNGVV